MNLKFLKLGVLAVTGVILFTPVSISATGNLKFKDNFGNGYDETWNFINFEDNNGVFSRNPGVECGVDACAQLVHQSGEKFVRISVASTTTEGIYTNTDMSEVELGTPTSFESGQWTASYEHPVTLEATVRWNGAYNQDGSGTAVGTSGIILWNSAISEYGPMPQYDHIGFTWMSQRVLGGFQAGLVGGAVIDQMPQFPVRSTEALDIHEWLNLKMVWSEDENQVQSVEYFIDGESAGTIVLPVRLQHLSVEMWNDNQEPTFTPTGLSVNYPAPSVTQQMDVDKILVKQHQ